MKSLFMLGLLFGCGFSAQAQQSPTVAPSQPLPTEVPPPDSGRIADMPLYMQPPTPDSAARPAPAKRSSGAGSTSAGVSRPAASGGGSDAETYNAKAVKEQHKTSEKVAAKRRRQTSRYAAVREDQQLKGIRRMHKGKTVTASSQR